MTRNLLIVFLLSIYFYGGAQSTKDIDSLIDQWHLAAANADFTKYFSITSDKFVFLGTDPKERWEKKEFEAFCKPYFEKGKAWNFTASNRKWVFSENKTTAWFDEDLATWMKGCRGSGVIEKINNEWKLVYYNLTVLIENEKINEFIQLRNQENK
jgi:hypothetical protein